MRDADPHRYTAQAACPARSPAPKVDIAHRRGQPGDANVAGDELIGDLALHARQLQVHNSWTGVALGAVQSGGVTNL